MGVFDKLKNILFEDVEEEIIEVNEPVIEEHNSLPKHASEVSRFKNINYEEEPKPEIERVERKIEIEEEPVEEESPFQQFDEEEFERIATINKNRLIERDKKLREEKMEMEHHNRKKETKKEEVVRKEEPTVVDEPKRFIPSPVISPVYGILDKNYKKEDILPRASSDGTLPKIMDVDSVREKAFGVLEEEDPIMDTEVKITSYEEEYNDEDEIEEEVENTNINETEVENEIEETIVNEDNEPEVKEKIEEETKFSVDEEQEDDDELESDLFNLIDSMYQDEEE